MSTIQVLQIGMGPLGLKIANYINQRSNVVNTVAAIDLNPALVGKSLKEFDQSLPADVVVESDINQVLTRFRPDVALLTTVSDMDRISPQIEAIVAHGIPVVSTCEELSFPWDTAPELAEKIDLAAKQNNVAVVGTGVNPGFLMDALPSFLTSVCQQVESVSVRRFQDASFRRLPFQKKIGAGLSLSEFEERKANGSLRHVGLTESIQFIAKQMGWELDKVEDIISPVIAQENIQTDHLKVPQGYARGVHQMGRGWVDGQQRITLEFKAAIKEAASFDEIVIKGQPNIKSIIEGGVNGDVATCAIAINAVKSILSAAPGLHTMSSIPHTSYFE